ncbi:MAG: FtsX-like permease family protein [Rhodothermaceae bacterium]|nr:FtsX-like permease family protein [Rhodothermaceae bacterium]
MDYRLLIARRYLVSRRRITLISVVSGISVAGVALGVAALVVVLSVMNGFYDTVRDLLVSYDPHVRIEAADGRGIDQPDSLLALARLNPHVVAAAPFIEGKALLTSRDLADVNRLVVVRGVDPTALDSAVARAVTAGRFDVARRASGAGLVMGRSLAVRMSLVPGPTGENGSRVALLSAPALERTLLNPFGLPAQQVFTLRATYELDPAYDDDHVFIGLPEAQRLFRLTDRVTGIDLRLDDVEAAAAVQRHLRQRLPAERFTVRTWYDLQPSLYSVMQLEKWAASAILTLIIIVAAFNIVGALTMIVMEKRRDLGALQAMGASRRDVARIFLLEGLLVGGLGAGIGLALGLGLALLQQTTGLVKLAEAESFIIDAYPVAIRLFDVAVVTVVAVGLCVLAAVYPARRAATIEPAEAVRSSG